MVRNGHSVRVLSVQDRGIVKDYIRRIPPSAANFLVAQTGRSPIKVIKIGMPVETIVREPKDYQDNGSGSSGAVAIAEPRIGKNHPE